MATGQGWKYAEMKIDGMDVFIREMEALPENLSDAAQILANTKARETAAELKAAYPKGPGNPVTGYKGGNLRKGVTFRSARKKKGVVKAQAWVKNTAPHAWLYDHGTASRQTKTGANRGFVTGTHLFEVVTMRAQLDLQDEVGDLMRSRGLTVRAA